MYQTKESPTDIVNRSRCYAGIGSRTTPRTVLLLMSKLGRVLAQRGLLLRSGGSSGADSAFEEGASISHGKKEIFLPWQGFNYHSSPLFDPPPEAEAMAALCHPNWAACKPPARKLHARNCQQICGIDLTSPVDFVLFWAPERNGRIQGGTATAVNIARQLEIPSFNLKDPTVFTDWQNFVRADHPPASFTLVDPMPPSLSNPFKRKMMEYFKRLFRKHK